MSSVPIACTLSPENVVDRMEEWRTFLSTMVTQIERTTNRAALTLRDREALLKATDLAEREKACCPFFQFSIEMEGVDGRLLISVPMEAEKILHNLLGLTHPDSIAD